MYKYNSLNIWGMKNILYKVDGYHEVNNYYCHFNPAKLFIFKFTIVNIGTQNKYVIDYIILLFINIYPNTFYIIIKLVSKVERM